MTFFNTKELSEGVAGFGGEKLYEFPEYLKAIILIRKISAQANQQLGYLQNEDAESIVKACDDLLRNNLKKEGFDQTIMRFVGKPANRMIDEKISELISKNSGRSVEIKKISLNQLTEDVTLTAEAAAVRTALDSLRKSVNVIRDELTRKGTEFEDVVKCGRLGLKDSLPIRLGDEFKAHANVLKQIEGELADEQNFWNVCLLGSGDLGTGLGILPGFSRVAASLLSKELGYELKEVTDEALTNMNNNYRFVIAHAKIQAVSVALWKLARDLTILASGPRAGIREIVLPAVAPGSSIMPGKINPTVAELAMNICDKVFSNASGLNVGIHSGWLESGANSSLPLKTILNSSQLLSRACLVLKEKVIAGITANKERCRQQAGRSLAFGVLLEQVVDKDLLERTMKNAFQTGLTVKEAFLKEGGKIDSGSILDELFDLDLISTREGAQRFMARLVKQSH